MQLVYIEILGWVGVILLAFCGLPQLLKSFKLKNVDGVSLLMLFSWFFGESFNSIYILITNPRPPLIFNSFFNLIIIGSILFLYFKYKK